MNICDETKCTGCGLCISLCHRNAIELHYEIDGRSVAKINENKCINCGICRKQCPQNNDFSGVYPSAAYASWMTDENKKKNSASGGISYALAEEWIENGGIVFGAAWNNHRVEHIAITETKEICRIAGSKYVQSNTIDAFKEIRSLLDSGRKILFFGTPCQVDAVKKLKRKDNKNLVTVDLICHGTPSMKHFQEYLGDRINDISNLSCRDQEGGMGLKIRKNDGTLSFLPSIQDSWMKGFLHYFTLRENCYQCRYSCSERCGDITIGDFWGLNKEQMPPNAPKYISLVLINSLSGENLWHSIQDVVESHQRSISEAINGNGNLRHPTIFPSRRNLFLNNIRNGKSFTYALNKTLESYPEYRFFTFAKCLKMLKKTVCKIVRKFARLFVPKEIIASDNSVGIVTISRKYLCSNYGSLMQHYALRKVLSDNGYSPWRYETEPDYSKVIMTKWKRQIKLFFTSFPMFLINKQFDFFLKKHFGTAFEPHQKKCKKMIVGSDQVWTYPDKEKTLSVFDSSKKVAYAVSADWTASMISEGWQFYMKDVLPKLNSISVRENKGVEVLQALCPEKKILQTIDPTFLLKSADYNVLISSKPFFKKPTLFCYFVNVYDINYLKIKELEQFTSSHNLSLCISGIQGTEKIIPKRYYQILTPENWLRAYRDASMIITNSFHGTVFALIYNKPFVVFEQQERNNGNQNLRLHELAEFYNLKDRVTTSDRMSEIDFIFSKSINWNCINSKVREFSTFSKKWLLNSLADD